MSNAFDLYAEQFRKKFRVLGNKDMKEKEYIVEDGILSCANYFISIGNVTVVAKYVEMYSIGAPLIMIILGVLLSSMRLLRTFGAILLFLGIALLLVLLVLAKGRSYYVRIKLNSGDVYSLKSKDEEFIDGVIAALREATSDSYAKYVINIQDKKIQNFNNGIINKGNSNSVTMYKPGEKTSSNVKNMGDRNLSAERTRNAADRSSQKEFEQNDKNNGLNDMEWRQLMSYTGRIMNGMDEDDLTYIVLDELRSNIRLKDKNGVAKTVRMMKKDQLAKFLNSARSDEEKNSIMRMGMRTFF